MRIPDRPFTWQDAATAGVTAHQLAQLVRAGALRRPFTGVYVPAGLADSLELRARCAALVLPSHAVVCDRSAAWLHGVDCLRLFETRTPPALEVVSVNGQDRSQRRGIYSGKRDLRADEVMRLGAVSLTTPARTAVDLASLRGSGTALAAVEALMRACGLSTATLERQVTRHRGRRGVVQARRIIQLASPAAESPGESMTKWMIIGAGLPIPDQQIELEIDGWGTARLDLGYPELLIAVEYDGEEFHGPSQAKRDNARRAALGRAGWFVIVVRKNDLASAVARERWLTDLAAAINERGPQFRRAYPPKAPWLSGTNNSHFGTNNSHLG